MLPVRLFQDKAEQPLLGDRDALRRVQHPDGALVQHAATFADRLSRTQPEELSVLSFHEGAAGNLARLKDLSGTRSIVTLGGIDAGGRNLTLIATGGAVIEQAKMSLASEDDAEGVVSGDELNVFHNDHDSATVRWAVLNCHDYTHADIVARLLEQRIELLIVVTLNTATQLYWEYAAADVHRLFCFVVIVNAAELGGSAAFVPFRRIGNQPNAGFRTAGQIFSTRGPVETTALVELDVRELRRLRAEYGEVGLAGPKNMNSAAYAPLAPSEHFMSSHDRGAGPPPVSNIVDVELDWDGDDPLVAVVQLDSMPAGDYVACRYRLRNLDLVEGRAGEVARFEEGIRLRLEALDRQLPEPLPGRARLDFLVFPEVFVSRGFAEEEIVRFCRKNRTIAICGVDYPGTREDENRNSAWVVNGEGVVASYDKITRSQYDAQGDGRRMAMKRGDTLYRFVNERKHAFGVLICYDFSHFDLVHRINLEGRETPLDVLFVIAHNPSGELYRTCCVADSHRFYQHVILCNVATYGGSGVLAPVRAEGARQSLMAAGSRNETIAVTRLKLVAQRAARNSTDAFLHGEAKRKGVMMRRPGIFSRRFQAG